MARIYDLWDWSLDQAAQGALVWSLLWSGWLSSLSTATTHIYMQIQYNSNKNIVEAKIVLQKFEMFGKYENILHAKISFSYF